MKTGRVPTLSNKERLILNQLVSGAPKYGLQMVEDSRGALKRGTVYVTLGRMEQKGLIESRHESAAQSGALPRRMYRATAHGRRVLDAWSAMAQALAVEGAR
jgi:DNA-binding PadR family transcriptional regulator